jgi:ribonuclease P protein component
MAEAGEGRGARRGRRKRLTRSGDFDRVYREGRAHASRHLVLYAFPSEETGDGPRLGLSVGRKVGGAVERNRVKRLLRDAFWAVADDLPSGHDYVLVARAESASLAAESGPAGFEAALRELIESAGLWRS